MSDIDVIDPIPDGDPSESTDLPEDGGRHMSDAVFDGALLRRFIAVACVLVLLIPLTWLARELYVGYVAGRAEDLQREVVTEALDEIEERFNEMQDEMLERARQVGNASVVVQGLRVRARTELQEGPVELVDYFAELDVSRTTSIELYDFARQLVAWNGFSMPLDDAPSSQLFFESFRAAIATDANLRNALVVWWPVREGRRILGAVRVMKLISYDAPVRNEYLRDISLADRFERLTQLPVEVSFEPASVGGDQIPQRSRLLQGADGTALGRVVVDSPSSEHLVEGTASRFNDVLAFWSTLLLFWLMGGVWLGYRKVAARAPPDRKRIWTLAAWFGVAAIMWWGVRFALLLLDVPGRWQQGKAPLSPLFDPIHFASGFAGGLMQSTGDFLVTSLFILIFAAAFAQLANEFREKGADLIRFSNRLRRRKEARLSFVAPVAAVFGGATLIQGLTIVLAIATRRAVLDSTFDFFTRQGLLPETLPLIIFCSLIVVTISVILISAGIVWMVLKAVVRWWPGDLPTPSLWVAVALAAAAPLPLLYALTPLSEILAWPVSLSFLAVAFAIAIFLILRQDTIVDLLILRSVLPSIFLVTVLLYPLLHSGMDAKRRIQMREAADTFSQGRDPRVLFAIEQIIEEIRFDDDVFRLVE